ncbi:hypothetical protein OG21DRAFT_1489217 [Imleria badia]|nr:hypothetical protein OG21DRAFT_1489217 [Imleria badia]
MSVLIIFMKDILMHIIAKYAIQKSSPPELLSALMCFLPTAWMRSNSMPGFNEVRRILPGWEPPSSDQHLGFKDPWWCIDIEDYAAGRPHKAVSQQLVGEATAFFWNLWPTDSPSLLEAFEDARELEERQELFAELERNTQELRSTNRTLTEG